MFKNVYKRKTINTIVLKQKHEKKENSAGRVHSSRQR